RDDWRCRHLLQAGVAPGCRRRRIRDRSRLGDFAGDEFQTHGEKDFRHVSASSSLRIDRLEGKYGHRSVLDSLDHLCVAWPCDTETEEKLALQGQEYPRSWCGIERERCGAAAQIGECAGYSAR